MGSPARVRFLFLGFAALLASCGNEGSQGVPSAELSADPEVCNVPCELVLYSGVDEERALGLTFTWDFGDGPVEGALREFHVFDSAGTHAISVTVSDGQSSTTDTIHVEASAQPKSSGEIGDGGGSVSHGACVVTAPAGIASESFTLEVTELPSMELASERKFEAGRFEALGRAFEVSMPLKSSTAIDIAVKDARAEGADASDMAWLVRVVSRQYPEADVLESTVSPVLLANYALVPVTRVDADGTAHGDIYGVRRVQLVKMAEPLDVAREPAEPALAPKAVASPLIVTSFADAPTALSREVFQAAIEDGIKTAHAVFVLGKAYRGPEAVLVSVANLGTGTAGSVGVHEHELIELNRSLQPSDKVKKVVAHEYFHLIQNMHRNLSSAVAYFDDDAWFDEGTASWAMDEVFDEMPNLVDYYSAPTVLRFTKPLLMPAKQGAPKDIYETVAFWKWAEAKKPGIIKLILDDQYALTHRTSTSSKEPLENSNAVDYLMSLRPLLNEADFLDFVYNARYLKDYDTEETEWGELWSNQQGGVRLGPPKQVIADESRKLARRTGTSSDAEGDAEDNPSVVEFSALPHLTAHVTKFESTDLTGTLHVRFPTTSAPLDARVIIIDAETGDLVESDTVLDLSQEHGDVTFDFDPNKEAIVFVVDTEWRYPSSTTPVTGSMKAWVVDRCGALPTNVIDVTDDDELYAALSTASGGEVIRMAPGTYRPVPRSWTLPDDWGDLPAHAFVNNLTLAGSGKGETTLLLRGDDFASVGVVTYGTATIRDLTIDSGTFPAISAIASKNLTLCNIFTYTTEDDALYIGQWGVAGGGFLGIYNSSLQYSGSVRHSAMDLQCEETAGNLGVEILNSEISGWYVGVSYTNYSDDTCSVSVATDCQGFSNNELANVMHTECTPPDCTEFVEECP